MTEDKLFTYLQDNYFLDLVKARNQFSKWDCYSPKFKSRIELKCRRTHYDTLMIEKKKYDSLMYKALHNGDKPLYINSTPKGIYVFNLEDLGDIDWVMRDMPETTDFSSKRYIKKEVGFLNINQAKEIK